MKDSFKFFRIAGTLLLSLAFAAIAATPEQEKAFTDKYQSGIRRQGRGYAGVLPLHAGLRPGSRRVLQNDAVGGSRRENLHD